MSLEARWFYVNYLWLISPWQAYVVSGLSVTTLVIIYLRKAGYLSWVTKKSFAQYGPVYVRGFSVFWTYLWFAQFLLTYYANIPEESAYFYRRWEPDFMVWFWLNIVINFGAPATDTDIARLETLCRYIKSDVYYFDLRLLA